MNATEQVNAQMKSILRKQEHQRRVQRAAIENRGARLPVLPLSTSIAIALNKIKASDVNGYYNQCGYRPGAGVSRLWAISSFVCLCFNPIVSFIPILLLYFQLCWSFDQFLWLCVDYWCVWSFGCAFGYRTVGECWRVCFWLGMCLNLLKFKGEHIQGLGAEPEAARMDHNIWWMPNVPSGQHGSSPIASYQIS